MNELNYGLRLAIEAKLLADINATSGIQTRVYGTSIPVSIRKGITKLEAAGYEPSAIVLTPADFETVELAMSSQAGIEHLGLPFDAATRRLYGVPVWVATSQTAAVGHVLGRDAVALDTGNEGVGIQWSENAGGETFVRNEIVCRCEMRTGTSVFSPLGVVKVALA